MVRTSPPHSRYEWWETSHRQGQTRRETGTQNQGSRGAEMARSPKEAMRVSRTTWLGCLGLSTGRGTIGAGAVATPARARLGSPPEPVPDGLRALQSADIAGIEGIARSPRGELLLLVWSAAQVALVTALVAADGGTRSPLAFAFVLAGISCACAVLALFQTQRQKRHHDAVAAL